MRVVEKLAGSFCDQNAEYFDREKRVCIGPLLFARPIVDIVSFCPDKQVVSPLHKWEK